MTIRQCLSTGYQGTHRELIMRTEDLLAACLQARACGYSPTEVINTRATRAQRAELEPLLALVARLERLAPPRRESRGGNSIERPRLIH